jgi:hypothetical protein
VVASCRLTKRSDRSPCAVVWSGDELRAAGQTHVVASMRQLTSPTLDESEVVFLYSRRKGRELTIADRGDGRLNEQHSVRPPREAVAHQSLDRSSKGGVCAVSTTQAEGQGQIRSGQPKLVGSFELLAENTKGPRRSRPEHWKPNTVDVRSAGSEPYEES